jgi:hypothetical protein
MRSILTNRPLLYSLAAVVFAFSAPAQAALFVTTGQTGAQVGVSQSATQHWTYTVSVDVPEVDGGLFTMKKGPSTSADITFDIIQGLFSDFGTATPLLSVTLDPSDFTQQFAPVLFQSPTPIALSANVTYTAILYSSAPDQQNSAYFIKGGSTMPLFFVDEEGNPQNPGGGDISTALVPEPSTLVSFLLMGPAVMALTGRTRRRRPALTSP